jgi:MFS family permease
MWVAYFLNYCDRQAVFAMFLWVYAFGCPIAGQLADRFSKRLLVVLSLVVWSLVTFVTGFAGSAFVLLGLRAAMGVSEALFMPSAIALTANAHAPGLRSRAIAVLTTAQIAGTVGGSWFGGWMADRGQWYAGPTAALQAGTSFFLAHGQDPRHFDAVVVESPHCQHLSTLGYTRCPRSVFPLDADVPFAPVARLFRRHA